VYSAVILPADSESGVVALSAPHWTCD